jgi:hypothetical protein
MSEALSVLLGEDTEGLSANVVSRLKAQWTDEHAIWSRRELSTPGMRIGGSTASTRGAVQREFGRLAFKLIEEAEKTWRRIGGPNRSSFCWRAFPSNTANRCKTIDGFSRNSPPDVADHQAARTPLLTLSQRMRRVGIVALARRLAIALWRYIEQGEIQAGASLKPAAA